MIEPVNNKKTNVLPVVGPLVVVVGEVVVVVVVVVVAQYSAPILMQFTSEFQHTLS